MSKIKLTGSNSGYVEISSAADAGNLTLALPTSGSVLLSNGDNVYTGITTFTNDLKLEGASYDVLWDASDNQLEFGDNTKISFGASSDLQLYHDGTHSYVDEVSNGNLVLRTNPSGTYSTLVLQSGRENSIICNKLGSTELYHIGGVGSSSKKLETTSTGITISGGQELKFDSTSGGPYLLFHNRGTGTTDNSGVYNMGGISAAGYRDVANPSIVGSIQFERQPTSGGASSGCNIVFRTGFNGTTTHTHHSKKLELTYEGHLLPGANNQYDLGSTAKGWRNVYMNDLNLSNMNGDTNDVDGTQGSWTIQEGKDDIYIINRLNGKKFKIKMEEIS